MRHEATAMATIRTFSPDCREVGQTVGEYGLTIAVSIHAAAR
jgi:hypothetical protein